MNRWVTIRITKKAKEQLKMCKEEFIKHHPDLKYYKITDDKIILHIAEYYLES